MNNADWSDGLPTGWPAKRLKYIAPASTERAEANAAEAGYVGLENIESWTGRLIESEPTQETDDGIESSGTAGRFVPGDVLFGKLRPYLAKAFLADRDGVCSTELLVLRPTPEIDGRFLHYFLLCPLVISVIDSSTFGAKMPRANWDFIGGLRVPIPAITLQHKIADYLDAETSAIDSLIAEKERMLAILEEKRTALITDAVTRGLNPDLKFSPSGLDWIGEIPKHWRIMRFKHFARIGNGSTPNRENSDYWDGGDFPWLNSSVVGARTVQEASRLVTDTALAECHLPHILPPALLIAITGQGKTRGRSTVLTFEATINQHLAYVKPIEDAADCFYLSYLMDAAYTFIRSDSDGAGSTRGAITCEQLGNVRVPLPPLPEQQAIVESIRKRTARFDAVEQSTTESLALLRERRSAVITAAVTGQLSSEEMVE